MKHVAARHVGPQEFLQEEVSEDVAVLISVVLEPEVERQSGGQPDVGPVAHRGDHGLPPAQHWRGYQYLYSISLLSPVVIQEGTERNFIDEDVDQRVGALANLPVQTKL